jgi:hypothetical protein
VKVPWPFARCVLCLREPDEADEQTWLTDAHIIPASVGGRLSAPFLCRRCNSRLGAEMEAPLLADPGIRGCIERVANDLPAGLLADLRERQRWLAETDMGQVEAAATATGELVPLESATFRREENARAKMIAEWQRQGLPEEDINAHLAGIDAAEPGAILVVPGFTVRPHVDIHELEFALPFDEGLLSETLPLAIAFLYLALILGKTAYADELTPLRRALERNDRTASAHWRIDHRIDRRGCAPEHRLAVKQAAPVTVHVGLFQERAWWVTFAGVGLREKPADDYGIDIATGEEFRW